MESKTFIIFSLLSSFALTARSQGGGGDFPCLSKLMPCAPFLKTTGMPPATCCVPLKTVMDGDSRCLCVMFYNQALLKEFNVTQDEAIKLPTKCGLRPADLNKCKNTTDTPSPSHPGPAIVPATPANATSTSTPASNVSRGMSIFGTVFVMMASGMIFIVSLF